MVMKEQLQNPKVIAGGAAMLFILSLIGTGIFYNKSASFEGMLENEKALTEKLASEKLNLMRDIENFKSDLAQMKEGNERLDGLLADANSKLSKKESEVSKLGKDNNDMKKQLSALQALKEDLESDMSQFRQKMKSLQDENERLAQANAGLLAELQEMKNLLKNAMPKAANFKVEVMRKKKDKLTVSAKKTHVVAVGFDYHMGALASLDEQKIYLTVKDKDGNILKSEMSGKTTVMHEGDQKDLEFSVFENVKGSPSNLSIRFEPDDDMKAGVYEAEVFTQNAYLGSARFRLLK